MNKPAYVRPGEADLRHRLTNHPPESDEVSAALDLITEEMIGVGLVLLQYLPEGREKSLALTKLEELSMWSKAAIARNQKAFE
jgi:hypothetical protein